MAKERMTNAELQAAYIRLKAAFSLLLTDMDTKGYIRWPLTRDLQLLLSDPGEPTEEEGTE